MDHMCGLLYLQNRGVRFGIQTTFLKNQVVWDVMLSCEVGLSHNFKAKDEFIFRIWWSKKNSHVKTKSVCIYIYIYHPHLAAESTEWVVVCCGGGSDTQWDVCCKRFCTTTPVTRPRPRPVQFTIVPLRLAANLSDLHPDLTYTPYLSAWPCFKDSLKLTKYLSNNRSHPRRFESSRIDFRFCYDFLIK